MTNYAVDINRAKINNIKSSPVTPEQAVYLTVLSISVLAVLYLASVFATGTAWLPIAQNESLSELRLSLVECLIGIAAIHIPAAINKISGVKIPGALCIIVYVFVFCGTVLGEVFSLFYAFTYWDVLLHVSSGVILGLFGVILLTNFLRDRNCGSLVTPAVITVTAVCFAICCGVVWEIYEFSVDSLLGLNMQKCLLQDGTALVGKSAIADTMKDLIMDLLGGTAAAVYSFFSLKNKRGWLYSYKTGRANLTSETADSFEIVK